MPDPCATSGPGSTARRGDLDALPAGAAELVQGAARAALAVPAVTRLEPTLRSALHHLQATTNRWRSQTGTVSAAAEGVSIRRRGAFVDVHVDIVVSPSRPAHLTASAAQDALRSYITSQELVPGTITVAVLTLER